MRTFYTVLVFLVLSLLAAPSAVSQSIIINELYNSGTASEEWLELLVVQDSLDLRGWDLRDYSSGGNPQSPLEFTSNTLWSNLRAGTIIVVGSSPSSFQEDTDASDHLLAIKSNNALYFTGNVFNLAAGSDAIQIRNASDAHVFGISWGSANSGSLTSPKVHFTSGMTSGNTIFFNEDSLSELPTTANWTFNTSVQTMGIGNTPTNSAWIAGLRGLASGDGSGEVRISPDTLNGGEKFSLQVLYRRNTQYSINALRILIPSVFLWSQSRADISFTNMTANTSVQGDTITFTNVVFSADSSVITINNVTSPDSTAFYFFRIQSKENAYADVSPLPMIVVFGVSTPIADVKVNDANGVALRTGQLVTIEGVVTVANQFGGPSFVQDNSGGISVFSLSFSTTVNIGDEVKVSGVVTSFNGLNQIGSPALPVVLHEIISTGNVVSPLTVNCSQLFNDGQGGVEQYEGMLVRVNLVSLFDTVTSSVPTAWNQCGIPSGCNYRLIDASGHVDIRADNNVSFFSSPAPQGTFNVIGVVSQFKSSSPFIGGYQIMPRMASDIIAQGPIISEFPKESNITSTSMTISYRTLNPGTSRLRYGRTNAYELGFVEPDNTPRTTHSIDLTGLSAATIYYVQAFSVAGGDTSFAGNLIVSTSSPSGTTGQINVYFNKTVDTSVSRGEKALGNVDLVQKLVVRINGARRSIDAALYSLSGATGSTIASALVNAKNRGVKVRVIGENQNSTTLPWSMLSDNGIPVIFDNYGLNDGAGLHHNKFFVFDYRGGAPESVWVWTGSWNPTDPGTTNDCQNSIEIQDVALAGAYTAEFEEMWGSSTQTPNATLSRFGVRKTDNTPHNFVINGSPVQVYFSPGDNTRTRIAKTLSKALNSVNISLLTFTRSDLADTLKALKNRSKKVRVVLDNNTDTGNQFASLQSAGVDILLKGFSNGLLHHKYAIIDAEPGSNPAWLITGSYNWSNSAENSNDENTLIIQNDRVANLYLQEFSARYDEAGGSNPIVLGVKEIENGIPEKFSLQQNYPNPFNPSTTIRFSLPQRSNVRLRVFDVLGREVATLVNEELNPSEHSVIYSAKDLPSGVYFYRLQAGNFVEQKKMVVVK